MRIYRILDVTKAEGPYERMCIWVQGCSRRCEGCFARHTWDKNGGFEMSADEINARIDKVCGRIEGLTLLGGEPFEQAAELARIAAYARSKGLGVITFTGDIYEQLKDSADSGAHELLAQTDLLIDGAFSIEEKEFARPLVGSANQRFIFLSGRYSEQEITDYKNRFEIRVMPNGETVFNGMGDTNKLQGLLQKLGIDDTV